MGAAALYTYILAPIGGAACATAGAVARETRLVAASLAHSASVGAGVVYTSVICPGGEAVWWLGLQIWAAGMCVVDAGRHSGLALREATIAVCASTSAACRQGAEDLRQAWQDVRAPFRPASSG